MSEKEEFINICNITTNILDLPKDSLSLKNRDRPIVLGREVAGVIGLKQGIHRTVIAKVLNRNRTAIYHYERNHETWFSYYSPYRQAYLKVLKVYKAIEDKRKQFIDRLHLRHFIKELGLSNSQHPDVNITIKSGEISYDIFSDCFNFSNDMEILKDALNGYKCKINYKPYEV